MSVIVDEESQWADECALVCPSGNFKLHQTQKKHPAVLGTAGVGTYLCGYEEAQSHAMPRSPVAMPGKAQTKPVCSDDWRARVAGLHGATGWQFVDVHDIRLAIDLGDALPPL